LDPGSWPLFPELEPRAPFASDGYKAEQWQVPPAAVRAGSVTSGARARYVVFPRYVVGATTAIEAMSRAEGVVELARNTFHFQRHGRRALECLARLVAEVDCYRLVVGDLDAGGPAVHRLVGPAA